MSAVQLIHWSDHGIEELVAIANNINIWNTLRDRFPHPYTIEDARQWIEVQSKIDPPQNFAIRYNEKLVGGIGMIPQHDVNRLGAEIGYFIAEESWNKGIATEAVKQMTDHIFSNFEVIRIFAAVFENNKASIKVLEKC